MMNETTVGGAPILVEPNPVEALGLLHDAGALGTEPAPAASSPNATEPSAKRAKSRKGGFPKGGRRGPDGKLMRDGESPRASSGKEYDAREPLTDEVKDGPIPGGGASSPPPLAEPDPAIVAALKPHLTRVVTIATGFVARWTKNPSLQATEQEASDIAEAGAIVFAIEAPQAAAQTPRGVLGVAVLAYSLRVLSEFMPAPANDTTTGSPLRAVASASPSSQA